MKFTAAEINSSRVRTPEEAQALHQFGSRIAIYQLQGNLHFASTEAVVNDVIGNNGSISYLILEFKKVLTVNESACRLLCQLLVKLSAAGKSVLFTHVDSMPVIRRYMKAKLGTRCEELFRSLDDNDLALEWCENRLLETVLPRRELPVALRPHDCELLKNFSATEIEIFASFLESRVYQQTETIIEIGDEAHEMFFLMRGSVSVFVTLAGGSRRRLATFSAGMVFGEMAVIDRSPRSARIVADTEVECATLSVHDFDCLGKRHPEIKIKLLENLSISLCRRLRKANRELSLFD